MPNPTCFSARDVCAIRITGLTATGAPRVGADNGYVSKGVQITATPQVDQGEDQFVRDGCGDICAFVRDCPTFTGMDLEIQLCHLDALALGLMFDATTITETPSDEVFGLKMPSATDGCPRPVAVEWWVKAWDGGVQAEPDSTNNLAAYFHFVVPLVYFTPSPWTFAKGIQTITVAGKGQENINITSDGPYDDWPSEVALVDGINTGFGWWLEAAIPATECALIEVTSAAS